MEQNLPPNGNIPTQEIPNPKTKSKIIIGIIVGLVLIGGIIIFLLPKESDTKVKILSPNNINHKADPTSAPLQFQELTIPYLRQKTYESNLSELNEVSSNANYTSYATSYKSDEFKINGLLTKPTGAEPVGGFPAIIFVHGYIPPAQYRTLGPQYADYVDYLARNGFVVFKIDLRGHADSEGEPGGGYFGSDYITDILNARSALQKAEFVSSSKIGLWGHSMAGNALLRSFAVKPDIPAVVIWAGAVYSYTDRTKYGINDASYQPPGMSSQRQSKRREMFEKYGEPSETSEFWKLVAPTNYLNDLKGAIQINHAIDDNVVDIGYSRDLNTLLDATTVTHELHEYPSGGHNISGSNFNQAMQNTTEFYKKYLK